MNFYVYTVTTIFCLILEMYNSHSPFRTQIGSAISTKRTFGEGSHVGRVQYRSASIDAVVLEIYHHIADRHIGSYVYHSNRNPKNIKAADDIYVLFVFSSSATFIDLNKKKSYLFQEEPHDKNSRL